MFEILLYCIWYPGVLHYDILFSTKHPWYIIWLHYEAYMYLRGTLYICNPAVYSSQDSTTQRISTTTPQGLLSMPTPPRSPKYPQHLSITYSSHNTSRNLLEISTAPYPCTTPPSRHLEFVNSRTNRIAQWESCVLIEAKMRIESNERWQREESLLWDVLKVFLDSYLNWPQERDERWTILLIFTFDIKRYTVTRTNNMLMKTCTFPGWN